MMPLLLTFIAFITLVHMTLTFDHMTMKIFSVIRIHMVNICVILLKSLWPPLSKKILSQKIGIDGRMAGLAKR